MKKKMIVLLMAACMALTACGGSKKDKELDSELAALREEMESEMSEDELEAVEEDRAALQEELESEMTEEAEEVEEEEVEEVEIQYEPDPYMQTIDFDALVIQIDDMVLDFGEARVSDLLAVIDATGRYTCDTEPTELLGGKTAKRMGFSQFGYRYFEILCGNPTESAISISDAIVYHVRAADRDMYHNAWFPTGIRMDGDGLDYEGVKKIISESNAFDDVDENSRSGGIEFECTMDNIFRYHNHLEDWSNTVYKFTIDTTNALCYRVERERMYGNYTPEVVDSVDTYFTVIQANAPELFQGLPDYRKGSCVPYLDYDAIDFKSRGGFLEYQLDGAYSSLAMVINDHDLGGVIYTGATLRTVYVENAETGQRLLEQSGICNQDDPLPVEIDVSGVQRLRIGCYEDEPGEYASTHNLFVGKAVLQ